MYILAEYIRMYVHACIVCTCWLSTYVCTYMLVEYSMYMLAEYVCTYMLAEYSMYILAEYSMCMLAEYSMCMLAKYSTVCICWLSIVLYVHAG